MDTQIDWQQIEGTTRRRDHFLAGPETKMLNKLIPLVPRFIETYHLTWASLLASAIIVVSSFLAKNDIRWLWGFSFGVVLHYFTDALDGAVGRARNTGLVKWGFYVDHFLDFIFASAIISGYSLIFPQKFIIFFLLLISYGGHFINEALKCIALGDYHTQGYFGFSGTEVAILVLIANFIFLITGGERFEIAFNAVLIETALVLIYNFYKTQRLLWRIDMKNKNGAKTTKGKARKKNNSGV